MKKTISALMIIVRIGMAMPAQVQPIKLGMKGGINLARVDFNKSDLKTGDFAGFFIGLMAGVTTPLVGSRVDGVPLFSQGDVKVGNKSTRQNGLDIPINLKRTIDLGSTLGIYVAAGPDLYSNFSGDRNYKDLGRPNKKGAQIGINVGADVKLLRHLQIGASYNIPLNKTAE